LTKVAPEFTKNENEKGVAWYTKEFKVAILSNKAFSFDYWKLDLHTKNWPKFSGSVKNLDKSWTWIIWCQRSKRQLMTK